jgi:outer membrane receptor protein involved in Fe transport
MTKKNLFLVNCSFGAMALISNPALAQTGSGGAVAATGQPSSAAPVTPAQADGSQDIIVTAQKRDERLQDVPSSITVLSGANLVAQGMTQLADYVKQVPGMSLVGGSGPGQGQVVFRGVTTGSDHAGSVGLYLDDIPLTSNSPFSGGQTSLSFLDHSFDPDLADIDRVEVLEGPQSTLYGAMAEGGLIKYVTRKPSFDALEGSIGLSGSQIDGGAAGYGARGSLNLPLVDGSVAARVSAFYRRDPGFIDNVFNNQKDVNDSVVQGASLAIRAKISDQLENTVTGLVQNIQSNGVDEVYITGSGSSLRPTIGKYKYSSPIAQPSRSNYKVVGNSTSLHLNFATLTNVASYTHVTSDTIIDYSALSARAGGAPVSYEGSPNSTRYTDELRLVSAPGAFEWIVGGFYAHEKNLWSIKDRGTDASGVVLPSSSPYFNVYTDAINSTYEEKAVFGDMTYHFTPKLEGTVGIRYSANDQSFLESSTGILGTAVLTGNTSDSATNYLATLNYKPVSNLTVYLRAASAYRPGGLNDLTPIQIAAGVPTTFKSDRLWNYEGGVKASLLDHHVILSASVYHMVWSDVQISIVVQNFSSFGNAAKAKSDGAEGSIQIVPVRDLTIGLKAAYVDARLTADAPSIFGKNGDRLPFSSKFTSSVPVDYRFGVSSSVTGSVGGTYSYRGAQYTGFSSSGRIMLPSYNTLDLRVGLDWPRYSLLARVDNVTNTWGVTTAQIGRASGSPYIGAVIRPRTYGLSFQVRF